MYCQCQIPFQKSGRIYEVEGKLVTIHHDVVKKFTEWNTHVLMNDKFYDKKMIQVLLVIIVGSEDIANGKISEKALRFAKGLFMFIYIHVFACTRKHILIYRNKKK